MSTKCLVCEHPDGGSAHFGSTSCLACAAFFRRTVSLNINFVCKKDNNCTIYHELRMICRACRFEKCLAAGMRRECVQKRRSNKKTPKKYADTSVKNEIEDDYAEDNTDNNSPMSVGMKSPATSNGQLDSPITSEKCFNNGPSTSFENVGKSQKITRAQTPCSVIFPNIGVGSLDVLRFYVDQLRHSMNRRRIMFTENPLAALVEDGCGMPFSSKNPPPHSLQRQFESQRFDNLLAFDFCKLCPGFDLLEPMEKAIFYRSCSLSYCLLDIAWLTVQAYPVEHENPLMMFSDGSICTLGDMSYGWEDEEEICALEKKKLFFSFLKRFQEAVCRPLRWHNITEVEFAALKGLGIWKLGYCEYTQHIKTIAKEHEIAILSGLKSYYEETISDPLEVGNRLGNIILMLGTIFEMNHLILETFTSAELFGLFKIDTLTEMLLAL
ncbi:unnamed protein product [Caenorhabditis bovis]|uniref:Uncharacterized protein n=1 Tax=Caenorhabditis bovis TaxID=2654633 RepID=A0A8S1EQ07_9PELO|nr:unnamed protein product [Caenorhabditis bovis]